MIVDPKLRQHTESLLLGMRADRYSWWTHWRECADYVLPRRYKWLITPNQANRGSPVNQRIIDSTATLAHRTLSAGMMAGVTSPSRDWFRLTLQDGKMAEQTQVRQWLDEVKNRMMHVCAKSNYYTAMHVLYQDLGCFGTGVMLTYDDYQTTIRCFNPCAGEYYLANSDRLEVDTFAREYTQTTRQVGDHFGVNNLSAGTKQAYTNGGANWTREVVVAHVIEPNSDAVAGIPGIKGMKYRETYWEWGSTGTNILKYTGYHENPVIAPRWDLVSNDPYGRSPAMDALGDVKQLQVQQKRKGQGIDKMVNPPLLADASLKNEPASTLPGGITYVPSTAGIGMKPIYEVRPDVAAIGADIEKVQERIKSIFFYDLFLMISQLDTVRSAAEIVARKEEKLIMLGPVLERFQNEALDKFIDRLFNIMSRGGLLPPPPSIVRGQPIKVEYVSMLAEAQRSVMTSGIERLAQFVGNLAGAVPDALDTIDWDEMIDEYSSMLGVSPKLIKPYAEVLKIRAQKAQQQAQQQQGQNAMAIAQGAQTMSQTDVGGGHNALQMMMNGGA
jgi:hypothetical protein